MIKKKMGRKPDGRFCQADGRFCQDAPSTEEVEALADEWAGSDIIRWIESKLEARAYRDLMIAKCPAREFPPCMRCRDSTIFYCGKTGTECAEFEMYCTGWDKRQKRKRGK